MSRWLLALVLVLAGGGGAPASEPASDSTATPAAMATPTATAPVTAAAPALAGPVVPAAPGGLRLVLDPAASEARYRVGEQLANQPLPSDAVGRTQSVEGLIVLTADGDVVGDASRFEVDLTTLRSEQARRDGYLQRNTLQTDGYPAAVFVPRVLRGLPLPLRPGTGELELEGDLTLHGVTRPVTWRVSYTASEDAVEGTALTQITFADFGLVQPRVALVLSVEETIQLELDFRLVPEG